MSDIFMFNSTYSVFTTNDFLNDADFLRYVKYAAPEDIAFWENWKARNPDNLDYFNKAELVLSLILKAETIQPPDDFSTNLLRDINISINQYE